MSASEKKREQEKRVIGRWEIGQTLGKGGYSWVKRGIDVKTGKVVALKFMEKADSTWVAEQAKQVETEIEALKNIRHQNVMKLYAYNLNAQYPKAKNAAAQATDIHGQSTSSSSNSDYIMTILLVLEYAPGGELFDILYYTSALKESVARTYFKQIISGLEACHNANVVHRDLKPQNLLLDAKYNIKITDFGLSKIIQSDNDHIMKTTYVGTRGYQAPELLLNKPYDLKCDIFSVGVILFILLAGYPPFEQASKNDKWFKPLMRGNIEKFWKAHQKSPIAKIPEAKDLLTKMLCFDPKNRIDMNGIKSHAWMKGETLKQKELISEIRQRHRAAEKKRRLDIRKQNDLAQSLNPNKPIPGIEKAKLVEWGKEYAETLGLKEATDKDGNNLGWVIPKNDDRELTKKDIENPWNDSKARLRCGDHERVFGDWTYVDPEKKWYNIYELIQEAVIDKLQGQADFDVDHSEEGLNVTILANTQAQQAFTKNWKENIKPKLWEEAKKIDPKAPEPVEPDGPGTIQFNLKIFESTYWKEIKKVYKTYDDTNEEHEFTKILKAAKKIQEEHKDDDLKEYNPDIRDYEDATEDKDKFQDIYVCHVRKIQGPLAEYNQVMQDFYRIYCSSLIRGLPEWARKIDDAYGLVDMYTKKVDNDDEDDNKEEVEDDQPEYNDDDLKDVFTNK